MGAAGMYYDEEPSLEVDILYSDLSKFRLPEAVLDVRARLHSFNAIMDFLSQQAVVDSVLAGQDTFLRSLQDWADEPRNIASVSDDDEHGMSAAFSALYAAFARLRRSAASYSSDAIQRRGVDAMIELAFSLRRGRQFYTK